MEKDLNLNLNEFDLSALSEFLEECSDSDCESDLEKYGPNERPRNIISKKVNEVINVQIKNQFSYEATSNVFKLLNEMPGSIIQLPVDKRSTKSLTYKKFEYNILVVCGNCDEINFNRSECACGQLMVMNSKKNNFLIHFPLEIQVRLILERHFDIILEYLNRKHVYGKMSDIDDSQLYKKIREKNAFSYILPFTLNLDGAQVFKSSHNSLWPVQLYLNFLPPKIRFNTENIIISTLYFGPKKPNITNLLFTLATEFDSLKEKTITIYKNHEFFNFIPILIQCVCDLPARAEVQCLKNPTGKYSCSYCLHPGVPVKNLSNRTTVRYTKQLSNPSLRTHKETLLTSQRVLAQDFSGSDESDSINGIKGQSVLFLFSDIDIIKSVPTDYMHCVLLGCMKDLVQI